MSENEGGPLPPNGPGADTDTMLSQLISMVHALMGEMQELKAKVDSIEVIDEEGPKEEAMNPESEDDAADANEQKKLPEEELPTAKEQEETEEEFRAKKSPDSTEMDGKPAAGAGEAKDKKWLDKEKEETMPGETGTALLPKPHEPLAPNKTPEPSEIEHPPLPPPEEPKLPQIPSGQSPGDIVREPEPPKGGVPEKGKAAESFGKRQSHIGTSVEPGVNRADPGKEFLGPFKEYLKKTGQDGNFDPIGGA